MTTIKKKITALFSILTIIALAGVAFIFLPLPKESNATPNIVIVATGGTIAGAGKSSSEAGYSSSKIMVDELVLSVPNISKIANITGEQFSQIGSQDMTNEIWLKLAKRINQILKNKDVTGVVITHGTDTLEETAYFLNLVVKSNKPVVLVGSMRPSTSLSADGPLNLYNAVAVAANKESVGKGVLVVFNDHIYSARDVSKIHTTNVDAFRSYNSGPIGHAHYSNIRYYYSPTRINTKDSMFDITNLETLPDVHILYGYANQSALMTQNLVDSGVDGIVYAGVGDGNLYKDSLKIMIEAVNKGTVLVRSARVGSGFVVPNAEINDTEYGFVTADNLSPQKARILLMLALTKTKDPKEIQEIFWKY